jgi:hypothetical protein
MEVMSLKASMLKSAFLLTAIFLCVGTMALWDAYGQTQSFRIEGTEDWGKWSFPSKAIQLTESGIEPVLVRKHVNASLDAHTFVYEKGYSHYLRDKGDTGGIWNAGSNRLQAARIIDGDESTSWAPDWDAPERDWWVIIDLGRVVSAMKLRIVLSQEGDPFEFFKIEVSDGKLLTYPYRGISSIGWYSGAIDFQPFVEITKRNTEWVFEYDLLVDDGLNKGVPRPVHFVRFSVTGDRRRTGALAELEVYAIGEDVSKWTLKNGGSLQDDYIGGYNTYGRPHGSIDGFILTGWGTTSPPSMGQSYIHLFWDLGATYWVDLIRLLAPYQLVRLGFDFQDNHLTYYKLHVSDGQRAPDGSLAYELVGGISDNPTGQKYFDNVLDPIRKVRYLRVDYSTNKPPEGYEGACTIPGTIDEFQIFGEGYVSDILLESNLLDLGSFRNVVAIEWDADIDPQASVRLRTRSGNQLEEIVRYFDTDGKEITEKQWTKTPKSLRGEEKLEYTFGADWSGWSEEYTQSGQHFLSPNGRRYLQIQAILDSDDPHSKATLHAITLRHIDPMAREVQAEIWPKQVEGGVPTKFSYYILPTFRSGDLGVDTIVITTPTKVDSESVDVLVGGEEVSATIRTVTDTLALRLDLPLRSSKLIEVRFRLPVSNDFLFESFLGNAQRVSGYFQRVDAGNASDEVESEEIKVSVSIAREVINRLRITPRMITPNGDGVNDVMHITFLILKVMEPRWMSIVLYDLNGLKIRTLEGQPITLDNFSYAWDGKGDSGEVVAPGVYIFHLDVATDQGKETVNCLVSVTY